MRSTTETRAFEAFWARTLISHVATEQVRPLFSRLFFWLSAVEGPRGSFQAILALVCPDAPRCLWRPLSRVAFTEYGMSNLFPFFPLLGRPLWIAGLIAPNFWRFLDHMLALGIACLSDGRRGVCCRSPQPRLSCKIKTSFWNSKNWSTGSSIPVPCRRAKGDKYLRTSTGLRMRDRAPS